MTDFPEAGVRLVAETQDAYSAIEELASELDSITSGTYTVSVETEVDTSGLDSADIPVEDDTVTTTVDVEETDSSKSTLEALNVLKNTAIINTVWNIAGTAVDLFQKFGGQILQPMLDLDTAVAHLDATTGGAIPNARELVKNIFYDDLGESIDQVAKLVEQAHQIGAPVDEATRAALTFTHTFQDQNPSQVLNTLDQLVQNKLAPDFKTASDLITVGFQNGANRGGDLLQVLNNNATAIHDLGLTGPEALSLIKTGLDNGFKSAQDVVGALEKIKQNVTNAAGNATSDVSKTLKILGIANPAETGEAWSADFFKSVIDKIKNAPGLSDTEKEAMFTKLIGGKQGGKVFSAFLQLSPADADTIFANVGGAAERAAKEADNSLTGAFDDFKLAVEEAVQNWLTSSSVDLPGKIAALKTGLQNALDVLAKGGDLSQALTVALKPIGFDDEFQGLESMLGNFVIALLQIVASIQDISGQAEAATGTRAFIAQQGATQLEFDLKIANPDEVANDIATATSRGLKSDEIAGIVSKTIDSLIKEGTKDSLAQAQKLVDTLKQPIDQNKLPTLASGAPMNVEPTVTDEAITALQTKIDTALKEAPPPDVVDELSTSMGLFADKTNEVKIKSDSTQTPLKNQTDATRDVGDAAKTAAPQIDDASGALVTVTASADASINPLLNAAAALDAITGKAASLSAAADHVAVVQGQKTSDSNTPTSGAYAIGGEFRGTGLVGEKGAEIVSSNAGLAVLNNATTARLLAALQSYIPGGGTMAAHGGNSYTAINNNIVQSEAQADALGYTTAAQLRGMAGG